LVLLVGSLAVLHAELPLGWVNLLLCRESLPKPSKGKRNDPAAWAKALDNAKAQSEHQRNRLRSLELMQLYGTQAWKLRGKQLAAIETAAQAELTQLK
jgi:pre-mRNA-splicing factor SPF27